MDIPIPKEHHRFIIGKGGSKLKELENLTATKINIPNPGDISDFIHIVGPREGIERARHEIQLISEEQVKCCAVKPVGVSSVRPSFGEMMYLSLNYCMSFIHQ